MYYLFYVLAGLGAGIVTGLAAWGAAKFANKCEIKKLNRVVGVVLAILGIVTILIKIL